MRYLVVIGALVLSVVLFTGCGGDAAADTCDSFSARNEECRPSVPLQVDDYAEWCRMYLLYWTEEEGTTCEAAMTDNLGCAAELSSCEEVAEWWYAGLGVELDPTHPCKTANDIADTACF